MPAWLIHSALLAQSSQDSALRALRQGFVQHAAESNWPALITAALGLCGIALLLDRLHRLHRRQKPVKRIDYLFAAASVIGLGRGDLEVLRAVAARARLPQPVSMLLTPENFRRALRAAAYTEQDAPTRRRIDGIGTKLFGASVFAEAPRGRRRRRPAARV